MYLIINNHSSIIKMTSEISQCFLIKPSYYFLNRIPCRTVGDRGFCFYCFIVILLYFLLFLLFHFVFCSYLLFFAIILRYYSFSFSFEGRYLLVFPVSCGFFKTSAENLISLVIYEHSVHLIHTLHQLAPLFYSKRKTGC